MLHFPATPSRLGTRVFEANPALLRDRFYNTRNDCICDRFCDDRSGFIGGGCYNGRGGPAGNELFEKTRASANDGHNDNSEEPVQVFGVW